MAKTAVQQNQLEFAFDFNTLASGMSDLLTTAEAASLSGLARRTLLQKHYEGKIKAIKYGPKTYRWLRVEIVALMQSNYGIHANLN